MPYRKFTADRIFDGYQMSTARQVLIASEQGKIIGLVNEEEAGDNVEQYHGILTPGFVNCHCHLELSHMLGSIPQGTGMVEFLLSVMGSRNASPEDIVAAARAAERAMFELGTVAVGDICNTGHTADIKQRSPLRFRNFIETFGFIPASAETRFSQAEEVMAAFGGNGTIVPHAPYSVSERLFNLIDQHSSGALLTIHNQESHGENEFMETGRGDFLKLYAALGADVSDFHGTGRRGIASWLRWISGNRDMLVVHNTVTNSQDLEWVKLNNTILPKLFWCLCPKANLYINGMLADVPVLVSAGSRLVVGTDSLASNNTLDILDELRTLQINYPGLSVATLLQWATSNGALALGFSDSLGSFEKDKLPGIVLIENAPGDSFEGAISHRLL